MIGLHSSITKLIGKIELLKKDHSDLTRIEKQAVDLITSNSTEDYDTIIVENYSNIYNLLKNSFVETSIEILKLFDWYDERRFETLQSILRDQQVGKSIIEIYDEFDICRVWEKVAVFRYRILACELDTPIILMESEDKPAVEAINSIVYVYYMRDSIISAFEAEIERSASAIVDAFKSNHEDFMQVYLLEDN